MRLATGLVIATILMLHNGCAGPMSNAPNPLSDHAASLLPLFQALDALQAGSAAGPVAILQIGDSHTANDAFSGRMRSLLQARFGDAGRGMLPPGIPFRFYHPAQVTVTASGWDTIGSLHLGNPAPFGPRGRKADRDRPSRNDHARRPTQQLRRRPDRGPGPTRRRHHPPVNRLGNLDAANQHARQHAALAARAHPARATYPAIPRRRPGHPAVLEPRKNTAPASPGRTSAP